MEFKQRTLRELADMICGNFEADESFFHYRSSCYLTQFFQDCDTDYAHDGSTRYAWVAETLGSILTQPQPSPSTPPDAFSRVIRVLMDQGDAVNEAPDRPKALGFLNTDRKSTRLNSSHLGISYAVFCLKKNKSILSPCLHIVHSSLPFHHSQPFCAS